MKKEMIFERNRQIKIESGIKTWKEEKETKKSNLISTFGIDVSRANQTRASEQFKETLSEE
jgi:hypothetical protein